MEDDINKYSIKGRGYKIGAWNDSSGYKYWRGNDSNYIQITAYISNPKIVNPEKLKSDMQSAYGHFEGYQNTGQHADLEKCGVCSGEEE